MADTGKELVGMLAVSRAGHDRGTTYVIIRDADEYVYVADGRRRTVDSPKRKNRKHIQVIRKIQVEEPADGFKDLEIKRAIKTYQEETYVES